MLAVDTNVVVRAITADDEEQSPKARQLLAENRVYVSRTVLLECEWVLRKTYELSRDRVRQHLEDFAGLPQVTLEQPMQVAQALEWFAQGMDFADALHLAVAMQAECEALATFDRKLAAAARKAGAVAVKLL